MSELFAGLSTLNAQLVNYLYFMQRVFFEAHAIGASLVVMVDLLNVWRYPKSEADLEYLCERLQARNNPKTFFVLVGRTLDENITRGFEVPPLLQHNWSIGLPKNVCFITTYNPYIIKIPGPGGVCVDTRTGLQSKEYCEIDDYVITLLLTRLTIESQGTQQTLVVSRDNRFNQYQPPESVPFWAIMVLPNGERLMTMIEPYEETEQKWRSKNPHFVFSPVPLHASDLDEARTIASRFQEEAGSASSSPAPSSPDSPDTATILSQMEDRAFRDKIVRQYPNFFNQHNKHAIKVWVEHVVDQERLPSPEEKQKKVGNTFAKIMTAISKIQNLSTSNPHSRAARTR